MLEPLKPVSTRIYNTKKAKWSDFCSTLKSNLAGEEINLAKVSDIGSPEDLDELINIYTEVIHRSCEEAIPKLGSRKNSSKPPWWNSSLDRLKKEAVRKKRRIRNAAPSRRQFTVQEYVAAKELYNTAATKAATESWREFN